MIEKILERLEEVRMRYFLTITNGGDEKLDFAYGYISKTVDQCKEIVQEVAKEYGKDTNVHSNGWIPCSERLPIQNGWYLITNELGVVQQQYWGASRWQKLRDEAVIAWQPLPAPYQKAPSKCDTCNHYVDEKTVPPICYMCSKGIEDNYVAKEGE